MVGTGDVYLTLGSDGLAERYDNVGWNEFKATDMNLVSNGNSAATAILTPKKARVLILHEPVDAVTLGIDFCAEMSCDGGNTWHVGALVDEANYNSDINIISAIFNFDGDTGTDLRYRLKCLNGKVQKIHGIFAQWG
jgi:hypothetical protein